MATDLHGSEVHGIFDGMKRKLWSWAKCASVKSSQFQFLLNSNKHRLSCSSLAATQFLSAGGGVIERHLLDLRKIKPWAFYVFLFLVGADGETYSPYSSSFSLSYLPILQYGSCFILFSLLVTKKYVSIQSHFSALIVASFSGISANSAQNLSLNANAAVFMDVKFLADTVT